MHIFSQNRSMNRWWYLKPYRPFFISGIATTVLALIYLLFFPASEFDLSIYNYFTVHSSTLWLVFSTYLYVLAGIYFTAVRMHLKTRKWLMLLHYVFVFLFLLVLFVFSSYNLLFVQRLFSGFSFLLLISAYGVLFVADILLFIVSLVLMLATIVTLKKEQ